MGTQPIEQQEQQHTMDKEELSEYQQILVFLESPSTTQVLAPLDGDGREFWTTAEADPSEDIEIEIDGETKTYTRKEAIKAVKKKIEQLESV